MCGIFFSASFVDGDDRAFQLMCEQLKDVNARRGPDSRNTRWIRVGSDSGTPINLQLFASELRLRGNGDIVQPHCEGGLGSDVLCWNGEIFHGINVSAHENDGVQLFEQLQQSDSVTAIINLLSNLEGPYAFVYYRHKSRQIIFGRDPLGRRSLLIHRPSETAPYLLIASAATVSTSQYSFEELSASHIYCFDLSILPPGPSFNELTSRILELPRTAGSCVYATLTVVNTNLPSEELQPPHSLDVVPDHLSQIINNFLRVLEESVKLRVQNIPAVGNVSETDARLAVLFSGGIDCTVLAFIADRYTPPDEPIDLINVAFENPWKQGKDGKKDRSQTYMVPDRITGLQELKELRRLCPFRQWNFVEVDVPYDESKAALRMIEDLMYPARTVMDLSLASALFFAARGVGHIKNEGKTIPYTTPARVLLNGLGSDELLGGYGRHRTTFNIGGWKALIDELQLEIDRIPIRNLGRDDRIISNHGKESRHPFLSLDVVNFLAQLPVNCKVDPRAEQGLGDKMLLRMAVRRLGLIEASSRKKRAMQFGSRSARMHGEKEGQALLPNEARVVERGLSYSEDRITSPVTAFKGISHTDQHDRSRYN